MLNLSSVRSLLFALVVLSVVVLGMPTTSSAGVIFSVSFGPPALPIYEQPYCPGEGFLWTPGYWAYDYDFGDYYWVPGTWVRAPRVGFFWTPGYWAYSGNRYVFYDGYWGPQVGFYGGINYGYGYFGNGYDGGRWERGRFFYNRSVTNVNVTTIHNVYNTTVINRTTVNRVSYNGGNGGISARPTRQQESFARQRHLAPVADQTQHRQLARVDREQRASVNHGRPAIAATAKPRDFKDRVPAKEAGGAYNPPANRAPSDQRGNRHDVQHPGNQQANHPGQRPENNHQANHPGQHAENQQRVQEERQKNDRPPSAMAPRDEPRGNHPAPVTGDNRHGQQNQHEQQRVHEQQNQERQRAQQNQDRQNQHMEQQRATEARRQQAEQPHQQPQHQQRVEQTHERPQPPQKTAEPRHEQQPQHQQQHQNAEESKQKKDRPPNLR